MNEIKQSKRTAISRTVSSLPCRLITAHESLKGHGLHFGCGKDWVGTAILHRAFEVRTIAEYDPNFADYPEALKWEYDFIIANYVLNVLPPKERKQAIRQLRKCMKKDGVVYITVRTIADASIKGKKEFDGVRTSIGTFQRGYTVKSLEKELLRYFKKVELIHGGTARKFIMVKVTGQK